MSFNDWHKLLLHLFFLLKSASFLVWANLLKKLLLILLKLLLKQELLLLLQLDLLLFSGLKPTLLLPQLLFYFLVPYLWIHNFDVAFLETGSDSNRILEALVVPALHEGVRLVEEAGIVGHLLLEKLLVLLLWRSHEIVSWIVPKEVLLSLIGDPGAVVDDLWGILLGFVWAVDGLLLGGELLDYLGGEQRLARAQSGLVHEELRVEDFVSLHLGLLPLLHVLLHLLKVVMRLLRNTLVVHVCLVSGRRTLKELLLSCTVYSSGCGLQCWEVLLALLTLLVLLLHMVILHHALAQHLRVLQSLKLISRYIALLQQLLIKGHVTLLRNWCVLHPCIIRLSPALLLLYYTWDIPLALIKTHRWSFAIVLIFIIFCIEGGVPRNHFVFLWELSFRGKFAFKMTWKISVKTYIVLGLLVLLVCVKEGYVRVVKDHILVEDCRFILKA